MKIMASGPLTSRQTEEEKVEAVTDFISLDSRITADSDCSHEIKRCLLIGRTDVETEAPIFWLPEAKRWLIRKDPDAGKD